MKENATNGLLAKLVDIQSRLNAPKSKRNSFGNYNYRSCEDILEAVKPLLKDNGCVITITDEIIEVGNRIYVKATATISDGPGSITSTAFAREEEGKKGMDAAQVTGSASSYARKYSLNGLLAIDDNKDPDATNTHGKEAQRATATIQQQPSQAAAAPTMISQAFTELAMCNNVSMLQAIWNKYPTLHTSPEFKGKVSELKATISKTN